MQDKAGEKITMTAKIDMVEPEEDDPKAVSSRSTILPPITASRSSLACRSSAAGSCKAGQSVTATGKVYERMDAWWGLQKVTAITCK